MFEFPKNHKLCSEKVIKRLFSNSNSFVENPLRLVWKFEKNTDEVAIKSLIVVPKKRLNLASERNKVKRRIREALRKNKLTLDEYLKESKKQINLAIIYQQDEILDSTIIEEKIKVLLGRLKEDL